jgi:DNA-binding IclR family transcriptional regulator
MDIYKIKVLDKLFKILNLFCEEDVELTTGEISKKLSINRTSTFRIISNLEAEGYLERDPRTAKYRLGLKWFILANLSNPHLHLKRVARPLLEDLNQQSGETVHLAVLSGGKALYLDKIEGKKTIRVVISRVGQKLPAHCTGVGKVLLAFLPEIESRKIVTERGMAVFTDNTITSWNELRKELHNIRQNGFAFDREEIEYGLSCVAAPVFSCQMDQSAIAAISVSMPVNRMEQEMSAVKKMVQETAGSISKILEEKFGRQGATLLGNMT